jgi:hypothetical protein
MEHLRYDWHCRVAPSAEGGDDPEWCPSARRNRKRTTPTSGWRAGVGGMPALTRHAALPTPV